MKHARNADADLVLRLLHAVADAVVDGMSTTQRVVVGGIAGVFALTPFGAWDAVVVEPEPLVAGEEIEVGPFDLTVVRAVVADELGFVKPLEEGNRLLAVVVEVSNQGEKPAHQGTLVDAIPPPADAGIVPRDTQELLPTVLGVADATSVDVFNPGLPYRMALIWEQDGAWAQDEITVDVAELTWIEEDTTFQLDDQRWFAYGEVLYRGRLAVETGNDQ
ncbi:hypothetical protein [Antribacter gilvus]|uniref:hypothetical protein n=1 Tax=Antribacter gilvus TaxID=2304675 RepID=UPI000F785109|nr:hypothetical protein [Antribacter gilvus]